MVFFMKKRTIVLDMFTCRQMIYDAAKPKPAAQFYPEWWKNLKPEIPLGKELFPTATMRRCMGFVDHYKHGFIVPMWADFKIRLGEVGNPYFEAACSDNTTHVNSHPAILRGSYLPESQYAHIKLATPWAAKCKEDVYWKWEQPTYGFKHPNKAIVLPGTIEYKYQYSMNANLMFARQAKASELQLDFQQPLVHVTPLSERPFELRYHMVDTHEYDRLMQGEKLSNINRYRAYRRVREAEESKCPFGFGSKT
jgi:hypothetical protein